MISNIAVGYDALALTSGYNNVAIGANAISVGADAVDESAFTTIINAAVDEQRRRFGMPALDVHTYYVDDHKYWPGAAAGVRRPGMGQVACRSLDIYAADLIEAVVNAHQATFG